MPGYFDDVARENRRADAFVDLSIAAMKPPGAECGLTYWTDATVDVGDVIESAATGRRYLVTSAHRTRGTDPHWALRCVVMHPDDATPADATVHPLHWFPRSKAAR